MTYISMPFLPETCSLLAANCPALGSVPMGMLSQADQFSLTNLQASAKKWMEA